MTIKAIAHSIRYISDTVAKRVIETMARNFDIIESRVVALESPEAPGWIDMELKNSWVKSSALDGVAPQYFKDKYGHVFLRGIIASGTTTSSTVIATLPVGYRPKVIESMTIVETTASGNAYVHVTPTGDIEIYGVGGSSELSINCDFFAED